jgi:cysteine sulfinate desulfinase/cysteine desulfurase-like protein
MIALMWANNETGVIHPIREISELAEKHNFVDFKCLYKDTIESAQFLCLYK